MIGIKWAWQLPVIDIIVVGGVHFMKHIGILVPSFPVASETFIVTEINALVANGHTVTVVTFDNLGECYHE